MPPKQVRIVQGTCWQCKDRRVLCDLKKPVCGRCSLSGQSCDYSAIRLRWGSGIASRGRHAGHTMPNSNQRGQNPGPVVALTAPSGWELPYFAHEVLPRFSVLGHNLGIDHSIFTTVPEIQQAVIAISNAHRLIHGRITSPNALLVSKEARLDAIKAFRMKLETGTLHNNRESIFSINVLLCILDGMIMPQLEDTAASRHFLGGKAILQSSKTMRDDLTTTTGTRSLFLSIFATIDVTYAILTGICPCFNDNDWTRFAGTITWWTGLKDHEPIFIETMGVLTSLASMRSQSPNFRGNVTLSDLLSYQLTLERLHGTSKSKGNSNPTGHSESVTAFCSAYIMTANVYMYRAICGFNVTHNLVRGSVQEGLSALSMCKSDSKLIHCLVFPLLVLGSHSTELSQQSAIKEYLRLSANYLSFGSLKTMLEFLEGKWATQDDIVDWVSFFQPLAHKTFLF